MHKLLLAVAAVATIAACSSGTKKTDSTTPETTAPSGPSPCVAMSQHMRAMVMRAGEEEQASPDMLAQLGPIIERVVGERCTTDAWIPEVIACVNAADDKTMDPCIEKLTPEQNKALEAQIERELAPVVEAEAAKAPPQ